MLVLYLNDEAHVVLLEELLLEARLRVVDMHTISLKLKRLHEGNHLGNILLAPRTDTKVYATDTFTIVCGLSFDELIRDFAAVESDAYRSWHVLFQLQLEVGDVIVEAATEGKRLIARPVFVA